MPLAKASHSAGGLFTSPHLIDYRERVRVNGLEITEEKTASLLTELRELVADWEHHPTFFELTLALGMRHFRDSECDLIVLETGMGGRLDATTAIPADVCVLTSISLDHTKWLGSTLDEIAREKAAIAIKGKPILSSPSRSGGRKSDSSDHQSNPSSSDFYQKALIGLLAVTTRRTPKTKCCSCLRGNCCSWASSLFRRGSTRAPTHSMARRFEKINETLILDAAHNPHAAEALVKTWQTEFPKRRPPLFLDQWKRRQLTASFPNSPKLPRNSTLFP